MTSLFTLSVQLKEASELVNPDTRASYYAANYQFTVGKIVSTPSEDSLHVPLDDLNEEGMKVYNIIQEKINKEEWEDEVMEDTVIDMVRSGSWKRNIDHPLHEQIIQETENCEIAGEVGGSLCTWRNLGCTFTHEGESYVAPIIIMYTDDWVYTYPNALHKVKFRQEK